MDVKPGNRAKAREIIQKYDFSFLKRFGQNFLVDEAVLERIVDAADISGNDVVLETGPGLGALTVLLAERAAQVLAVEIDERLMTILEDTLKDYANVVLINGDIMKTDIAALAGKYGGGHTFKAVADLPYYLTTPLMMKLMDRNLPMDSITVMVQREAAVRMQAEPGTSDYGTFALAVQYYAKPEVVAEVGPESFIPQPKVGSSVVHLRRYEEPPVKVKDPDFLFHIIRATFQKRRKTLLNSITNSPEVRISRDEAAAAIASMGLPPTVRGETLSLSQFAQLADLLYTQAQ